MPVEERRPDPDHLLQRIQEQERRATRGRLKIFLGYASGAGKSFRMFDEARRRRERGQNVVIAGIQPGRDEEVEHALQSLEVIPGIEQDGRVAVNVPAILERKPQICVIDGLAYDNPPGMRHPYRWQDVADLLDAGISVVTSLNLQHVEERRDLVERITGKRVTQTVPLKFLSQADEIVVVDIPPELLLERKRQEKGKTLADDQLRILSELREHALLLAADVVDAQLSGYLQSHGVQALWGTQERIMVCITPRANAELMISSGKHTAERFRGELFVVYVYQKGLSPADRAVMDRNLELARAAHARVEIVDGEDPVETLISFARSHGITQLFVGHSMGDGWLSKLRGNPIDRMIRAAEGIDVRVFPH